MRGWRIKFIFLLIVYFAGFATAIYTLAPTPSQTSKSKKDTRSPVSIKEQLTNVEVSEFAKSFKEGMHKCIDFGKEAAWCTAKFIKQKVDETQTVVD